MRDKRHLSLAAVPLAIGLAIAGNTARADDNWSDRFSFSGFASANYHITDDGAPYNGESGNGHDSKGSFQGTRIGLNFRADISERFNFAGQLFSTKDDEFGTHLDWGFGTLKLTDELDFRAGRIKYPAGLVGEYVDVGYAYPWISAPEVIYSELGAPNGPQITRESYTGVGLVGNHNAGDWTFGGNLFGGEVDLSDGSVRKLRGITVNADWNDLVLLQGTWYKGEMNDISAMPAMNGEDHEAWLLGARVDWNNVVVYSEYGHVEMGRIDAMQSDNWYATLGYRFGNLLPFINYQSLDKGKDASKSEQTIAGVGLRWDVMPRVALKAEINRIDTDKGEGLFAPGSQPGDEVMMYGFGLDTVF